MQFILKWLIVALSVLGAAYIVPGITVSSFYVALEQCLDIDGEHETVLLGVVGGKL
jgi:hypothetical protein